MIVHRESLDQLQAQLELRLALAALERRLGALVDAPRGSPTP